MANPNSKIVRPVLGVVLAAGAACSRDASSPRQLGVNEDPIVYSMSCKAPGTGFGAFALPPGTGGVLPFTPVTSLKAVVNPIFPPNALTGLPALRTDLVPIVADVAAATQLGKALFWDVQAGSDDKTACATCHHQAGADVRTRNQLHPGANGLWDSHGATSYGPNFTLGAADFPFTDPLVFRDLDDVAGSQGVRASTFVGIDPSGAEITSPVSDPIFGTGRQVTGLNAPTTVNAVHNHRNFFNARADYVFNGVNPFGNRDVTARVWKVVDTLGNVGQIDLHITAGSLASQAVGPPLNPVEMSAAGRTFPDLGRKLLLRKPLGLQKVSPTDGALGALADPVAGLTTTYAALIQKAFNPVWWNTSTPVTVNGKTYSLMEANFALIWGIAIMMYESTLVSDDSPMDRYAASRVFDIATAKLVSDNPALLDPVVTRLAAEGIAITRQDILTGLDLFEKPIPLPGTIGTPPGAGVGCAFCHVGAETTSASVRNLTAGVEPGDIAFKNAGYDLRMERMLMGVRAPAPTPPQPPPPVPLGTDGITYDSASYAVTVTSIKGVAVAPQPMRVNTYDVGWYNIGVRPTTDNLGLGGLDPFGKPLSFTEWYQKTLASPSLIRVAGGGLGCVTANGTPLTPPSAPLTSVFAGEVVIPGTNTPIMSGGLLKTEGTDVAGTFKTLSLRNVELSGPYFHNGGKATLRQVVEFYDDGGNFGNATLSPLIRPMALSDAQMTALVAFLVSLTDDRVLYERAPFDHPALPLPAGQDTGGADIVTTLPAVGAAGNPMPVRRFLGLNPFQP